MPGGIGKGVLGPLLDTLPVEISFIDASNTVAYFNKGEKREIFPRPAAVIGRKVQNCHPPKSLAKVEQILGEFKSNKRDAAEFWIDNKGRKIYIRYFAVRDEKGEYLGCLEVSQDITKIKEIEGEKRLL